MNGCQGDGFWSMGTQTVTIKFAMAGTLVGLHGGTDFPPLLDY